MDMLPVENSVDVETLRVGHDEITVLAGSADTGGDLFAVELRMAAGGGPPVMHRHAPSEVYRVLAGEMTFYITGADGRTNRQVAGAGQTVTLAGNTPHTIRNESDSESAAFVVHTPGTAFEGFVRAGAALAADGEPTMDEVLTIAAQNGIGLLGPIPTTAL